MTKLSLFTPTHDPKYLMETFESLARQDYKNWEWVLVPNAQEGKETPVLPEAIVTHEQVKLAPFYWKDKPKIGELKRYGCDNCEGDVLIELDHDDLLVPGALRKIADTFERTDADFIYSDDAGFAEHEDQILPHTYHGDWGWETYDFELYGRTFIATRTFDVSPRSLCEIYFAPDHVRCWKRDSYYKVGGHNPELTICDDHDLMVKTYLAGMRFEHIGGVGYLYRFHPENTVKSHAEAIQKETRRIRDENMRKLIAEWIRRQGYEKYVVRNRGDILSVHDMPKNVGWIEIEHDVLPSLPRDHLIVDRMRNWYHSLQPGGYLSATFPLGGTASAFAPIYASQWSAHTFEYFTHKDLADKFSGGRSSNHLGLTFPRFQFVRYDEYCKSPGDAQLGKITAEVDLCALHGQRQPGRVYI